MNWAVESAEFRSRHAALLVTLGLAATASLGAQVGWTGTYGARARHALFYDADNGQTVLFGGSTGSIVRGDAWELEDGESAWASRSVQSGPEALEGVAAAFDAFRGEGVMFGGLGANGQPSRKTWIWRGGGVSGGGQPPDPAGRWDHAMAYDEDRRRIVMFGGFGVGGQLLRDTWEWDGFTWTRFSPVNSPTARARHAMGYLANGKKIVLFGGRDDTGLKNDVWSWDGLNWTLSHDGRVGTVPSSREGSALARRRVGEVMLVGGLSAQGFEEDLWEWDGSGWAESGRIPAGPRADLRAVRFPSSPPTLRVAGGRNADGYYSDVWDWDGSNWTNVVANQSLPGGRLASVAYDPQTDKVLLYAGSEECPPTSQLWEWQDAVWTDRTGGRMPDVNDAGVVFDSTAGELLVCGGRTPDCDPSWSKKTWRWDGSSWRRGADLPEARYAPAVAIDSDRDILVLFGGHDATDTARRQTWERSSNGSWSIRSPATVPPSTGAVYLAYDPAHQCTLLLTETSTVPEHWQWNGSDWTRVQSATAPPLGPMTFDVARQLVVANAGDFIWEWDGLDWTQRIESVSEGAIAYHREREQVVSVDADGSLWFYGPLEAANYSTFGTGCSGSGGIPTLSNRFLPWIGCPLSLDFTEAPNQPGIVWIGFSTSAWNGLPLPLDLSVIGISQCTLYTGIEISFPIVDSSWTFSVPNRASLLGAVFYNQALFLDPGTNPFGAVITNAGQATIGGK